MTTEKSDKEKALEALRGRPDGWTCSVNGEVYDKTVLTKEVNEGTAIGVSAEKLLTGLSPKCDEENKLGKRYRCMVCGTEALMVNAGNRVECCSQPMEPQEPRVIPSSD